MLVSCVIISTVATGRGQAVGAPASQQTVSDESRNFVMGERRGRIAVWREGEAEPFMTTDTLVYSLPKADRSKLAKGIVITGESAAGGGKLSAEFLLCESLQTRLQLHYNSSSGNLFH